MRNLVLAFICLFLTVPCLAEIIIVDNEWPYDFNNIQAAIDYSSNGDFIFVFPGTYTGPGNRDIDFLGKAITVRSADPNDPNIVAATIIDSNGTAADLHHGFCFQNGEDSNSILNGFTITNGYGASVPAGWTEGGGIACVGSSPTISNCRITNNTSAYNEGGGIYCRESNPIITSCVIGNNSGSGIYCSEMSNPKITSCVITGNTGSGIFCNRDVFGYNNNPTISNCTIADNSNLGGGGGICCDGGGILTITNCNIVGNSAGDNGWGGGIYCGNSDSVITGCNIMSNISSYGGGIYCCDSNNPTVTCCAIVNNIALEDGGGICVDYPSLTLTITDCNISGNSAGSYGGGIFCGHSGVAIKDCNIACNNALSGGGLFNCGPISNCIITENSAVDFGGGLFGGTDIKNCTIVNNSAGNDGGGLAHLYYRGTVANCIIWSNRSEHQISTEHIFTIIYSDIQGGYPGLGNIDADPCFVNADAKDYHLKSEGWSWDTKRNCWTYDDVTSRCIDAGNPGSPLGNELLAVPRDPDNIWGQNLRIDMGAFGGTAEASIPPYDWALLADLTNDGIVNLEDFTYQAADWLNSADQQPGDLNRDGLIDMADLALLVEDWLAQTSWH